MNSFTKFFHELFNPHCEHCADQYREMMICESCEILKTQLDNERANSKRLLDSILQVPNKPNETNEVQVEVNPRSIPWRIRQQMLENEDRKAAQILRDKTNENFEASKTTQELEKELLGEVNNG